MTYRLSIILIIAATLLISACGGSGDSPEGLMDRYTAALKAKDIDALQAMSVQKFRDQLAKEEDQEKLKENLKWMCDYNLKALEGTTAAAPVIEGDKASIVHTKKHITVTVKMEKENGKWAIAKCSIKDETPLETPAETPAANPAEAPAK